MVLGPSRAIFFPNYSATRISFSKRDFIDGFIKFPKPLIALVNGPAVGIAFTVLALFDMVIASDKATFSAPFTRLSLSPEGCSSYTFPKLMGRIKAADILVFNRKITAQEALGRNLVARVIADERFQAETAKFLEEIAKIPQKVSSLLSGQEARNDE